MAAPGTEHRKQWEAVPMKKKTSYRSEKSAYLMILPSYLIFFIIILVPIGWTFGMSFTDYNFKTFQFVGIKNYLAIFQDELFLKSILNTIWYSVLTIIPSMVLSLLLAIFLNAKIPGRGIFRTIFYLPHIPSMVAVAMAWSYMYNTQAGIINKALNAIGISSVGWLSDGKIAMISVAIMSVWASLGYYTLLNLSGLQGIPSYLYEAASIDGATGIQQFFYITIPSLRPTTFFIFVMACIASFEVFGQVYIMTNGGPLNSTTTIAHQVYLNGFQYYKMGYASAEAIILLVIILTITVINMKFGGGSNDES